MRNLRRVRSLGPDGTATLEDGTEMQLVMSETGSLGLRPKTQDDLASAFDQYVPNTDQGAPMPKIDLSGLDQAV